MQEKISSNPVSTMATLCGKICIETRHFAAALDVLIAPLESIDQYEIARLVELIEKPAQETSMIFGCPGPYTKNVSHKYLSEICEKASNDMSRIAVALEGVWELLTSVAVQDYGLALIVERLSMTAEELAASIDDIPDNFKPHELAEHIEVRIEDENGETSK